MLNDRFWPRALAILGVLLCAALPARAETPLPDLAAGVSPSALAVNPVTNKLYVANSGDGTVTVIAGRTGLTTTVTVGSGPAALAVNPATARIYAVNRGANSVSVIDGLTGAVTPVTVGATPVAVAVNPVTNRVYVANQGDGTVTEIDGATLGTRSVTVGTSPSQIAVDPQTNLIYVVNAGSDSVSVIDGGSLVATPVSTGAAPTALAINAATGRVYIANETGNSVTVLDETNRATSTLAVGARPSAVVVNPATNTIYIANQTDGTVSVIDGATTATATVTVGAQPVALAVDPAANKVYVASQDGTLTVLDGASNATASFAAGTSPTAVAVNPVTHRVYVANKGNGVQPGTITALDGATNLTITVPVGGNPSALALNPVTGQVYVANQADATVSAIDGASKTTAALTVGALPQAVAINPATNRLYVANATDGTVSVIDFATGQTATVAVGASPSALAVNPVTNQIYVANFGSASVTILDGASNGASTVAAGTTPSAVAVNTVTNQIYVANAGDGTVTIIDGASRAASAVTVGTTPSGLAINPETNAVYVANRGSDNVSVIKGNAVVATVNVGQQPTAVAVNPVTNFYYVTNSQTGTVTVIDGAANTTSPVTVGTAPGAVAVNSATNRIYVANKTDGTVSVIDGATRTVSTVTVGAAPDALAIDPATGEVYVANGGGASVSVIAPSASGTGNLAAFVDPLPGNATNLDPVTLHVTGVSLYGPVTPAVRQLYYQADSTSGPWLAAAPAGASGQVSLSGLLAGLHTLYVFAADGLDATSTNTGPGSSPIPGRIAAYSFVTAGGGGSFSFQVPSVLARSTDAAVSLVVQRNFTAPATVDFEALSGTALAGQNFGITKGTLTFGRDQLSQTISIPLENSDLGQGVAYFTVQLSNPSGVSAIGSPGSAGVFLLNAFSSDLAVSNLSRKDPAGAPASTGALTVTLAPPEALGQWRLFGELAWRNSGATVPGLVSANYQVEFRPVAAYTTPPSQVVAVPDSPVATATGLYTASSDAGAGSLSVTLAPAGLGGWRLQGEATFRDGGTSVSNLSPGSYLVEFAPASGRTTPATREIFIEASRVTLIATTYATAEAAPGSPPVPVAGLPLSDPRIEPAQAFTGQIQTDGGFGTGFVPLDRIVVTAAHVLFEDASLGFATGTRWLFQHDPDRFAAPPQIPRGIYVLEGYAAQRTADASPGALTAAARQLDAAAMYFLEPSARGGQSGYLASNSAANPWLTNSSNQLQRDKFLAGYPVSGRLHATSVVTDALAGATGSLFTTNALGGFPGFAGGPLFVGYNDVAKGEIFYPAAIYLGSPAQTVVRAIDAQIIDLMSRAQVAGNGGANNVGGGILRVEGGLSGNTSFALGSVNFVLQPAAVAPAARWGFAGGPINRRSGEDALNVPPGAYQVQFSGVAGYTTPAAATVQVAPRQPVLGSGVYAPKPPTITSAGSVTAVNGQPFSFRVTASPAPKTYATPSALPDGLMLHTDTGVIDGTPMKTGLFPIAITATGDQGPGAPAILNLTVARAGQLNVAVSGSGAVTPTLAGSTIQAVDGRLTIKATPAAGFLFDQWSTPDAVTVVPPLPWRHPIYTFVMPPMLNLRASFVPNPFPTLAGAYHGLLRGAGTLAGRGSVTLAVTSSGSFTGTLYVGAHRYTLRGVFDPHGVFAGSVPGRGLPSVLLNLQLDTGGANQKLSGAATVSGLTLDVQAWKAAFTARAPAPQALGQKRLAHYTMALRHSGDPLAPQGDGYGMLTVTPQGAVRFVGTLGDGSAITQGTSLGQHGEWPFFMLLYGNSGVLTGLLNIAAPSTPPAIPAVQGTLDWIKPLDHAAYYPAAVSASVPVQGTPLTPIPPAGLGSLTLTLGTGGLSSATGPITFTVDKTGKGSASGLSLQITAATGMFTGKFTDVHGKVRIMNGAFLSSPVSAGFGLFKGDQHQTGAVEFQPAQ